MTTSLIRTRCVAAGITAFALLLCACATPIQKKEKLAGTTIRSLNYSAREVAYISVEEPDNPNGGGGGEALNPYGSGGYMCCFAVPSVWRPDFQVVVTYQFYPEKEYHKALLSVPPYPDGKAGDIWLIVHADESAEAVVSLYGPSRDEWPGKVKGYPVPSREYRLKLWERDVKHTKADLDNSKTSLAEFSLEDAKDYWEFQTKRGEKELQKFTGYDDLAYGEYIKDKHRKSIEFFSKRLDYLLRNKP